jgi:putative transposase
MAQRMLAYKTRWCGSELALVPPQGTSQSCSACGHRDPASRCSRDVFRCTACGFTEHADLNAANAILQRGLALRSWIGRVDVPTPEDTRPGSACGALCLKHGVEPGNEGRETGRPVLQGGE